MFSAFYACTFCDNEIFTFLSIIIASYFSLSSLHNLFPDVIAWLFFHDPEFLWGTGFFQQIQLSELQNDEENDM